MNQLMGCREESVVGGRPAHAVCSLTMSFACRLCQGDLLPPLPIGTLVTSDTLLAFLHANRPHFVPKSQFRVFSGDDCGGFTAVLWRGGQTSSKRIVSRCNSDVKTIVFPASDNRHSVGVASPSPAASLGTASLAVMALKCHLLTLAIETKVSQTMFSEPGSFERANPVLNELKRCPSEQSSKLGPPDPLCRRRESGDVRPLTRNMGVTNTSSN
jgi:hypothetical protein